jgi:glutamate-1-semialdehyde 2,1-aminomutase
MFGFFFHDGPVQNFAEAKQADAWRFQRFFAEMLDRGVYLAPSPFEAGFVSLSHTRRDIQKTLEAARAALQRVAASR